MMNTTISCCAAGKIVYHRLTGLFIRLAAPLSPGQGRINAPDALFVLLVWNQKTAESILPVWTVTFS
jgi:hypothetical protein